MYCWKVLTLETYSRGNNVVDMSIAIIIFLKFLTIHLAEIYKWADCITITNGVDMLTQSQLQWEKFHLVLDMKPDTYVMVLRCDS